jgi:hypothetical protein
MHRPIIRRRGRLGGLRRVGRQAHFPGAGARSSAGAARDAVRVRDFLKTHNHDGDTMSALPESFLGAAANDADAQETREWLDALSAVIGTEGVERAHFLLEQLISHARRPGIDVPFSANTAYVNTIPTDQEERSPGNIEIEERLRAYMRWNAMAMVVKANRLHPEDGGDLGGHISSFASLATMFGTGFNHFWHAEHEGHGGDLLYIQGHSSPGSTPGLPGGPADGDQLLNFRQEVEGKGISSYPHPKLMPTVLAVPDGVDGPRPADGDLPGALPQVPARPRHRRTPRTARSGSSAATARWTSRSRSAPSAWRRARSSTT